MTVTKRTGALLVAGTTLAWVHVLLVPAVVVWWIAAGLMLASAVSHGVPKLRRERPTLGPPRLLSEAEFAKACSEALTPTADPEPDLPDTLPEGLRDPGFAASRQARERARSELEQGKKYRAEREHLREMAAMLRVGSGHWFETRRVTLTREDQAAVDAIPLLTERHFVGLTHCPEGHIGDQWVGDADEHDGVPTVHRTCRFAHCGAKWQERR